MTPRTTHVERKNFELLLALYRPPAVLRKEHKDLLKLIWSLQQHFDGTRLRCTFCKKVKLVEDMTCHHNDNVESHNDFSNLSPGCYPCQKDEAIKVSRRRRAEVVMRERKSAAEAVAPNTSEEIIRHDEGLPAVTRLAIRKIQNGWKDLRALKKQLREDMLVDDTEAYQRAVKCLKLKAVAGSIVQDTNVAIQTIYHYFIGFKNEINGWCYVADTPDGKLLDFTDPEDHRRDPEEIYQRVKPKRKPSMLA